MRLGAAALALGLILLSPAAARSQEAPANPAAAAGRPTANAPAADSSSSAARDSASATAMADSAAATTAPPPRDLLAEVHSQFTPENRAYSRTRVVLAVVEPIYTVLLALLLLFSGLSSRLRDLAERAGRLRYLHVLVYLALFTLVTFLLTLPLTWYGGYALEHQYGLSRQSLGQWFLDELKGEGFDLLFFGVVPLVALAYRAFERAPRTWWLWVGLGTIPVTVIGVLIGPLVVEPAFNKFTPLHDAVLRQQILDLAARADIPARKVLESDMSSKTSKLNAYVSGFGASQRIVLWDTTLERMKPDEILFVMGHEMGHYKLGHIWKGIAWASAGGFALFFLAGFLMRFSLERFGERWGVRALHDIASLPLVLAVLVVLSIVAQPISNKISCDIEHEADVFGLELTRTNDAAARAFLKLAEDNRSDPEPSAVVKVMLYDHPPLGERIRFALDYRPWESGQPNRFFHGRP
jgi:Zn-dependent protease with chaperone function